MSERDLVASVLNYFNDVYASNIDWGHPSKFDPEKQDLKAWVSIQVKNIRNRPRRHGKPRHGTFNVVVECHAREEDNVTAHMEKASAVSAVLDGAEASVQHFLTEPATTVGVMMFDEAVIEEVTSARPHWTCARLTLEGRYQEL